jgi:hypothetical protein
MRETRSGDPRRVLPPRFAAALVVGFAYFASTTPAILAQRHLAAGTSTGVSAVYGKAGLPWIRSS